jgi:hypothetical protein
MKRLLTIALMVIGMMASAQISNIKVNDQITINKLYAGMLAGGQFSVDSNYNHSFVSVRFGTMATWQPAKWFAVKSWGIYHLEKGDSYTLQQFWFAFTPHKKLTIQTGYMATLATEQRPHPATGDGQFETFSEAQIPGGAYNIKITATPSDKISFGACVAYRKTAFEYQAMFNYRWIKLSGWYDCNKKFGSALTLDFSRVYNVTSWRQDQVLANFICIKLGKNKDYCIYSDNGFDFPSNKLIRSETGFLKTFDSKWIKGLFGLGWRNETRTINGYLFVHL